MVTLGTCIITTMAWQVEASDLSQQLYSNSGEGGERSPNPLYKGNDHPFVSVLKGQLMYNSASREVSRAKYSYVVSTPTWFHTSDCLAASP